MIAVIFEVEIDDWEKENYLALAGEMRPLAEAIEGFVSIERFASLANPTRILSLSFWRDEAALEAWRSLPEHRAAQKQGRTRMFRDYRLRVAEIKRDYGMSRRSEAPADSREYHSNNEDMI